jgi:predicted amidophosphoribosyltransferase
MQEKNIRKCPGCGQKLRFPNDIGGLVMVCPSCGKKFYSDFKVRGAASSSPRVLEEDVRDKNDKGKKLLHWLYDNCFCLWFKS